jgi:hypothetical protein
MMKNALIPRRSLAACGLTLLLLLTACSASGQKPATPTTIDPKIEELQQKVDSLEEKLNTITAAPQPASTQKPAPKIVEVKRWFGGNTRGIEPYEEHQCREVFIYSDGTEVESPRRWVPTTKDYRGIDQFNC